MSSSSSEYVKSMQNLRTLFDSGITKTLQWRLKALTELRKRLIANEKQLYKAAKQDLNRNIHETVISEFAGVIGYIDETINNLPKWLKDDSRSTCPAMFPSTSYVRYEPKGIVLCIGTWNFPIATHLVHAMTALASGNCVVVKPSEVAPACERLSIKLLKDMEGVEVFITSGNPDKTQEMLKGCGGQYSFDHIVFVGGTSIGAKILEAAAPTLTPCTLELGGKNPVIWSFPIDIINNQFECRKEGSLFNFSSDKKLEVAIKRLLASRMLNWGQLCSSPDYVLLTVGNSVMNDENKKMEKVRTFAKMYKSVYDQTFKLTFEDKKEKMGRIVNQRHFDRVMNIIKDIPNSSIINLVGDNGFEPDRDTCFYPPQLVLNPSSNSGIMTNECYAPILSIIPIADVKSACKYINSHPSRKQPLCSYIFLPDDEKLVTSEERKTLIDTFVSNVQAGGTVVNDCCVHDINHNLPYGGIGKSGMGRLHGFDGFKELSHHHAVMDHSLWLDTPDRYPPFMPETTDAVKNILLGDLLKGLIFKEKGTEENRERLRKEYSSE